MFPTEEIRNMTCGKWGWSRDSPYPSRPGGQVMTSDSQVIGSSTLARPMIPTDVVYTYGLPKTMHPSIIKLGKSGAWGANLDWAKAHALVVVSQTNPNPPADLFGGLQRFSARPTYRCSFRNHRLKRKIKWCWIKMGQISPVSSRLLCITLPIFAEPDIGTCRTYVVRTHRGAFQTQEGLSRV